jgi:hypothetical protein
LNRRQQSILGLAVGSAITIGLCLALTKHASKKLVASWTSEITIVGATSPAGGQGWLSVKGVNTGDIIQLWMLAPDEYGNYTPVLLRTDKFPGIMYGKLYYTLPVATGYPNVSIKYYAKLYVLDKTTGQQSNTVVAQP